MRYPIVALVGTLILMVCACGKTEKPSGELHVHEANATGSVDKNTAAQNRINSFFYAALVPKLQSCWGRVQGKGEVGFKYTFRREGTNWRWQQQEIEDTTIPQPQAQIAQQCMQEAARESSFPMEAAEAERKATEMVIHWTWPVPLPSSPAVMAMMISTGTGSGSVCKCQSCSCTFTPGVGTSCQCAKSCFGFSSCVLDADKKGCSLSGSSCLSGQMLFSGSSYIALKENP